MYTRKLTSFNLSSMDWHELLEFKYALVREERIIKNYQGKFSGFDVVAASYGYFNKYKDMFVYFIRMLEYIETVAYRFNEENIIENIVYQKNTDRMYTVNYLTNTTSPDNIGRVQKIIEDYQKAKSLASEAEHKKKNLIRHYLKFKSGHRNGKYYKEGVDSFLIITPKEEYMTYQSYGYMNSDWNIWTSEGIIYLNNPDYKDIIKKEYPEALI